MFKLLSQQATFCNKTKSFGKKSKSAKKKWSTFERNHKTFLNLSIKRK